MKFDIKASTLGAVLASLTGFFVTHSASAATLNGGFEDGLNGWTVFGDVSTQTADFGATPTEGSSQALLTNSALFDFDGLNFSGNNPLEVAVNDGLAMQLGLTPGDLNPGGSMFGAFEGSAIRQTFTASEGDRLSFDWNFLSDDTSNEDFAFVLLNGELLTLASMTDAVLSSGTPFATETGFQTFTRSLSAGDYTLSLGIVDVDDFAGSSGLLVDNVMLTANNSEPTASVPEYTSAIALLSLGLLLCAGHLRKA